MAVRCFLPYHMQSLMLLHLKTDKIVDPISHAWIYCLRPSGGTPVFVIEFSYLYIVNIGLAYSVPLYRAKQSQSHGEVTGFTRRWSWVTVRTKHDPSYYKSDHQLQNLHSLPSQVGSTNTDLLRTQTYLTGDISGRNFKEGLHPRTEIFIKAATTIKIYSLLPSMHTCTHMQQQS